MTDWPWCRGFLVPYNVELPDGHGGTEKFWPGAFATADGQRRPLLLGHDVRICLGTVTLRDRADGLGFDGRLLPEALITVGLAWRDVSVQFVTRLSFPTDGGVVIVKAKLIEVSVVADGAYHPYSRIAIAA